MNRIVFVALTTLLLASGLFGRDPEQQTVLQGSLLQVPLARKGPHTTYSNPGFALYRLAAPEKDWEEWSAGIVRVELSKREQVSVAVQKPPIVQTKAVDGVVYFSLPYGFDPRNDCFVMVNWGSWVTPRAGEKTVDARHLIALKPFRARKAVEDARRQRDAAFEQRQLADHRLAANRAYRNGQCVMPKVELPARPKDAMAYDEAVPVAEAIVIDAMSDRVGCEATSELLQRAGLLSNWRRFTARFTCGRTGSLQKLVPQTELTPLVDYLESRLLSCAAEDKLSCLLAYAFVISKRFEIDRDRVASRLSESHRRWEWETQQAQTSAQRAYEECQTDTTTVESGPAAREAFDHAVAAAEEALKRYGDAPNAEYRGDALRCDRKVTDYLSRNRNLRFVGLEYVPPGPK